tara:strand:- start:676 stop:1476 length:801 start_codon:yes stop_codon:yes gene_type:complete
MKHPLAVSVIALAAVIIIAPGPARADACAVVEREMTFGEVALKQASDQAGYMKSAREFEAAAKKAPGCAAAQFNLGLVLEKAGQYEKARLALLKYLELVPNAPDAAAVRKKTYELEYLAREGTGTVAPTAAASQPASPWAKLEGQWCQVGLCRNDTPVFDLMVKGEQFSMVMRPFYIHSPTNCKIGQKDILEGSISATGAIQGTRRSGGIRFEPRCVAGRLPINQWNYETSPMTGRVTGQGAILEFTFNQYVSGRPHPVTLQYQRR